MERDVCALCKQPAILQKSHVIPNSIFRRIKRTNAGRLISFTDSANSAIENTIDSWWDYLLCKRCEAWLGQYEKHSLETLRSEHRNAHAHEGGITFREFDYKSLKLFFVSLLWRAHVSTRAAFAKVMLPASLAEDARQSLLLAQPPKPRNFGCQAVTLFDSTPNGFGQKSLKQLLTSPFPRLYRNHFSFVFVLEGYLLEIHTPHAPYKVSGMPGFLKDSGIWFVPNRNVFDVKELVSLFVSGYGKAEKRSASTLCDDRA